MYGEKWRNKKEDNFVGLIPKLSKRIGLLKRLKKFMTTETFSMVTNGIFNSTPTPHGTDGSIRHPSLG